MSNNLTIQRERQLVRYAISLLDSKLLRIYPIYTHSVVFPIIFLNSRGKTNTQSVISSLC